MPREASMMARAVVAREKRKPPTVWPRHRHSMPASSMVQSLRREVKVGRREAVIARAIRAIGTCGSISAVLRF